MAFFGHQRLGGWPKKVVGNSLRILEEIGLVGEALLVTKVPWMCCDQLYSVSG